MKALDGHRPPEHGVAALADFPDAFGLHSCQVTIFFNIAPSFPCFAVLIDSDHAIVVHSKISHEKRSKKRWRDRARVEQWERVGTAIGFNNSEVPWHDPKAKSLFETVTIY
jgi:hypothetical protein